MKQTLLLTLGLIVAFVIFFWAVKVNHDSISSGPQRFWEVTAVDTVKYSRDPSRDPDILTKIPRLVAEAAKLNVTHIAIDTPYDEEFYPVLKAWVDEARQQHLHVWFRGNFSGWEGWFGYSKFDSIDEHNQMTRDFIQKHPDLFEDGDIFTPLPEPENGGPGDPRGSDEKSALFNDNLVSSYNNCTQAFEKINIKVHCGFFSTNGDIAKTVLTPSTVAKIGNIVVIDHYVDSTEQMQSDLDFLQNKFPGAKIVLGEFGAPIPDINGDMNEDEQNVFVKKLLDLFYQNKKVILGLNYWTLAGGSTQVLNEDGTERKVFSTLANYYLPIQLTGRITDSLGNPLSGVVITDKSGITIATTSSDGGFSIGTEKNAIVSIAVSPEGYKPFKENFIVTNNQQKLQDIQLQPTNPDFIYKIHLFFTHLLSL